MRPRFAAALLVLAVVAAASLAGARPFPPEPDFCATQYHRGPTATSCPFLYGGGRVTVFSAGWTTEAPATTTVEIVLGEQVLASCTAAAGGIGPFRLPLTDCVGRSTFLPVADGTELRCRHRGPGEGVFGCLSP